MSAGKQALYGPAKVGGDTLSFCTKCKMELAHVIVSMVDGAPAKVICKTCKSEHKHRKTGGATAKKGPRAARTPVTVIRAADYWEKKVAESRAKVPKPYNVQGSFATGDLVEHSKFGLGFVEDAKSSGKMTVIFREGEKLLVFKAG